MTLFLNGARQPSRRRVHLACQQASYGGAHDGLRRYLSSVPDRRYAADLEMFWATSGVGAPPWLRTLLVRLRSWRWQ